MLTLFSKGLLTFSFFFIHYFSNATAETILLKADRWCPFNCEPTGSNNAENGYMIDIARKVFEKKGHNVVYQVDSWANAIRSVREGKATGLVATTRADAPDLIYTEKEMGTNKECFYVKKTDLWEFITPANLKGRKLGTVESYAYSAEISSFILENPKSIFRVQGESPLEQNIKNLESGLIDTIVENPFVFNYFTEKKKIRDHYADAGCTNGDSLYIAFSPKNPRSKEFAKMLNEGILQLRKDGTLDKIISKYSLKEWNP